MKKKEIASIIYADLGEVLLPRGFKLKKRDESFVRIIKAGEQRISVPLVDLRSAFKFSITVGVRIEEVENIFHLFSGAPAEYQGLSSTTLTQLNYFTGKQFKEYSVSTPDEVSSATADLRKIILEKVFPFLDRCMDLDGLYQELCVNPDIDSTLPPSGFMHTLILSRLAKSASFENLAIQYKDAVASFPVPEREKLFRLVEYLSSLGCP